jgi:hypothetical protein
VLSRYALNGREISEHQTDWKKASEHKSRNVYEKVMEDKGS